MLSDSNRPIVMQPQLQISRRGFLTSLALAGCATQGAHQKPVHTPHGTLIGYTEYRTNLPTRYDNQITSRACVVGTDGQGRRPLAESLASEKFAWTQFAGWAPDGKVAIIGRGWESPENAAWEEENKTFRMTEGWLFDMYTLDMTSNVLTNLTSVERVSAYNTGILFLPGQPDKLGFTALINGISHPYIMDRDGKNKRDLTQGKEGFTYGVTASPDGKSLAYHKDYQIYVANADGSEAQKIETGNPFNFVPQWSADSQWLMFVSGEHYNCHPYVVHPDGTELRKLADRGGHTGVKTVYDVFDFHGGSSDVPVWTTDGNGVLYTSKVGEAVELMSVTLQGRITQLTRSPANSFNYHPKQSPDGKWIVFGSDRTGTRQLYIMPSAGGEMMPITDVTPGSGAMWAHWQPAPGT
jgi:TolB protein